MAYGKIFSTIFDSTLASDGGWMPTYIFMSMISLADKDGIVSIAPKALYRRLGFRLYDSKIDYSEFESAIEFLQIEDDESNSKDENGKRIIPLSEIPSLDENRGWLIVNYDLYRKKSSRSEEKGASTKRVREFRERNKNKSIENCNGNVTACNDMERNETPCNDSERDVTKKNVHTDTDTDTDTDKGQDQVNTRIFEKQNPGEKNKPPDRNFYLTKKKRKLNGDSLIWFEEFWNAFDHKHDKASASDSWIDLPWKNNPLDLKPPEYANLIIQAAELEAANRPALIQTGLTPKWPQGWLSGRRFEDEHNGRLPDEPDCKKSDFERACEANAVDDDEYPVERDITSASERIIN